MTTRTLSSAESPLSADDVPESVRADQAGMSGTPLHSIQRVSTFADLLPFAGTWAGDDFEERLADVYAARGDAEF